MKSPVLQASLVRGLVLLSCVGLWLVLVHGSGSEINSVLEHIGVKPWIRNSLHPPLVLLLSPDAKLVDLLLMVRSTSTSDKDSGLAMQSKIRGHTRRILL